VPGKIADTFNAGHTSDTYNFDRNVEQFVMIQEEPAIFLHGFAIAGERRFHGEKLLVLMLSPMINEGGLSLISGKRPTTSASFGKSCSTTLRWRASAIRFRIGERVCLSWIVGIRSSMSMCAYQTSSTCISLNSAIRSRYDRTHVACNPAL
jgi:hypothetical protein